MAQRTTAIEMIDQVNVKLDRITSTCGLPEHINKEIREIANKLDEIQHKIATQR